MVTTTKALIDGSSPARYHVLQAHAFDGYASEGLVLDGTFSYLFEVDDSGQLASATTIPGTVEITGYCNCMDRHWFTVTNSGGWQTQMDYRVDDYPETWNGEVILLPLTY